MFNSRLFTQDSPVKLNITLLTPCLCHYYMTYLINFSSVFSSGQHQNNNVCSEVKRDDCRNCYCVVLCMTVVHNDALACVSSS